MIKWLIEKFKLRGKGLCCASMSLSLIWTINTNDINLWRGKAGFSVARLINVSIKKRREVRPLNHSRASITDLRAQRKQGFIVVPANYGTLCPISATKV
jgi:hypothetical protein